MAINRPDPETSRIEEIADYHCHSLWQLEMDCLNRLLGSVSQIGHSLVLLFIWLKAVIFFGTMLVLMPIGIMAIRLIQACWYILVAIIFPFMFLYNLVMFALATGEE